MNNIYKILIAAVSATVILSTGMAAFSADTFKTAFDRFDNSLNGGLGYSNYNNFSGHLAWGESYIMMSYMAMYKATDDIEYLKKLVMHAENVINQRDDKQGRVDYRGVSGPTWVATDSTYGTNGQPYAWVAHSGMITYPMADFVQLVINDLSLHSHTSYSGKTFIDVANWLKDEVAQTIAAHNDEWDDAEKVYRFRNTPILGKLSYDILPFNHYAAMGRTLLMMYLSTGKSSYLYKASALVRHFLDNLTINNTNDSYIWKYGVDDASIEDISHASIEIDFAYLCYELGLLVSEVDMNRFASTFRNNIYIDALKFAENVDGTGIINKHFYATGLWLSLSNFDRDIYHIIADVFIETVLYDNILPAGDGFVLLEVANLLLYQSLFDPIALDRGLGSGSKFAGVATGDFDGDGIDEFVAVRNGDGDMFMFELDNGQIKHMATAEHGDESNWAGIAAGDFDGDGIDEFVAVRNFDGDMFMYEFDNGQIKHIATAEHGSDSNWAGIAAGDFDGDGIDEFVAVRNGDGDMFMYELDNGQIKHMATAQHGDQSNWAGIAAGDFDGDGIDEFVAVRNGDGDMFMYEFDGRQIEYIATAQHGSESNWIGITAGNFDEDENIEFIANRNFDGDFYIYSLQNGAIEGEAREFFPSDLQNGILAAGRLLDASQNKHNLVMIRNVDGDIYVYSFGNKKSPVTHVVNDDSGNFIPTGFILKQNFPNPFNPKTVIEFDLSKMSFVELTIYSILGERITTLSEGLMSVGSNKVIWDGRNDRHEPVPSGVYIYEIKVDRLRQTKKMLLLR